MVPLSLFAALAACAPSAIEPPLSADSPAPPQRSAEQLAALADGDVSADEYEQGFRAFTSCMSEAGFEVLEGGTYGEVYDYSYPESASTTGDYDRCYELHFSEVDAVWQIAHEDQSATTHLVQRCLRDRGIEPGETALEVARQLEGHGISFADC